MSVHYKFKSALEYDTVTFDGLHISVKDLKKAILQQKRIGKTIDFDLQITNAQTKETYTNDDALISKNASLIVARVPLTQQQRKQWENNKQTPALKTSDSLEQSSLSQVDISSLDLSEEDKIKTMMSQSTSDYDPSNYVKVRGSNQVGTVPASYVCFKCHQRGHWIKDCPYDGSNMASDTIKKSTGIPRSFMIEVEGPQVPGARMTPSGVYAVPAIDHEVYKEKKIEKPPFLPDKPTKATTIPEDLICGICKDLLQDAVMVPCCGISFCDECIRNYLVDSEESECPDCNEKDVSPDTLIPNRFLRNNVNTFKNETGYIKVKPQIVQRAPTPPRPSLPDFVPPPEYVESTTPAESQLSTKTDKSPILQDSPNLTTISSPFHNQTTPVYSEHSPYSNGANLHSTGDKCAVESANSKVSPKSNGESQNPEPYIPGYNNDHGFPNRSFTNPGQFRNFRHPPPRYPSHFTEPVLVTFPPMRRTQGYGLLSSDQKVLDGKGYQAGKAGEQAGSKEAQQKPLAEQSSDTTEATASEGDSKDKEGAEKGKPESKAVDEKDKKVKKSDMEVDDVSSVSSNTSEEPPPPVENQRADEGPNDPTQCPSYAIPSLFSGLHPVILPPPGSERYPPPRPAETFLNSQSDTGEERSSTPTVDERMEIPPLRAQYDPYRQPNYGMPYYDQHYSVPPSFSMPYDPNAMYDRSYRGYSRVPRGYRSRYVMRQPPPPGSRPVTPPRNEEEAYLAFQRMLKEKEERDKRKTEKLKASRRSTSRSRSRSGGRSRRSFSGVRSRSRTRSRTPARRTRSLSKRRSHTRSRSFVISRSRSRSYSRTPLNERNYSPKKYSPHRSPLRYDRFDGNYGHGNQDYRRGGYRSRGRKRFYNKSPPRGHDNASYNRKHEVRETTKGNQRRELQETLLENGPEKRLYERYRDENYVTSPPRSHRSPSRYYDQRVSPKCNDYMRSSHDRENRSGERETESTFRDRSIRRRSHSNSLLRNHFDSEKERERDKDKDRDRARDRDRDRERDRDRDRDRDRERDRERDRDRDRERDRNRDRDRENERGRDRDRDGDRDNYRHRSRSRRSGSRRYSPLKKTSEERAKRSKEKSPDHRPKDERDKNGRNRSRERRSYEYGKDKRKYSRERNRSKENDKENKRHRRSRERSRSRDRKKRSTSREKRNRSSSSNRKRRTPSRQRSVSRVMDERRRSHSAGSRSRHRVRSESFEKERMRSVSGQRQEAAAKKSASPEKAVEPARALSPKVSEKEDDDDKKEKKKDKEKKKKKKEEDRAARKKRKKEKKRKQEVKSGSEPKTKPQEDVKEKSEEKEIVSSDIPEPSVDPAPNFVSTFTAVEDTEEKKVPIMETQSKTTHSESDVVSNTGTEDNVVLELHTSYDNILEDIGDKDKKGILAPLPEISKWELDDNQVSDSNGKTNPTEPGKKSPEFPVKVTREVIKRAENAIFKRAVNAIREPSKISSASDKEERKDKKVVPTPEKDRGSGKESRAEQESEKVKRVFLSRDREKVLRNPIEVKPKTEVKRTINSLQITIPIASENDGEEEGKGKSNKHLVSKKEEGQKSPPPGRISVKDRLGSKVEKSSRILSPPIMHGTEKRSLNIDEESESKTVRKDYQIRPTLSSMIESIDSKRSTIDEVHFVPNYDESSDEEENMKPRHESDRERKSFNGKDSKKRSRSSSETFSEESTKKHKKKKSKNKKKKQKRSKKHLSESSDSSESEREKKKHKKSKKKKKSKH